MGRRREVAETNETLAVVPVFGVDPRGAALFAGVVNGTLGHLGSRVVIDANDSPWHGWTQSPQSFRGALGTRPGRPVVSTTTTIDQTRSAAGLSPAQAILEQRMTARRGL